MHRVFDGCEIHYFVAVNSSEVLGFTKILVTAHENYVDQIHVSPLASEAKLKLGWHLLNTIPTRIQQADLDKPVRLQVADRNTDAAGWYRAASFAAFGAQGEDGKWQPPPSSPWSELDEATKRYSGRWTSVKDLQEMTDPKCKLTPLKPEVHIRHFVVETSSGRRSGATDIPPPPRCGRAAVHAHTHSPHSLRQEPKFTLCPCRHTQVPDTESSRRARRCSRRRRRRTARRP